MANRPPFFCYYIICKFNNQQKSLFLTNNSICDKISWSIEVQQAKNNEPKGADLPCRNGDCVFHSFKNCIWHESFVTAEYFIEVQRSWQRTWFGTMGPQVRVLSPRPYKDQSFDTKLWSFSFCRKACNMGTFGCFVFMDKFHCDCI